MKMVVTGQRKRVVVNFIFIFLANSLTEILVGLIVAKLGGKIDVFTIFFLAIQGLQNTLFYYPVMAAATEMILLVTIKGTALLFNTWNEKIKSDLNNINTMSPKYQGKYYQTLHYLFLSVKNKSNIKICIYLCF